MDERNENQQIDVHEGYQKRPAWQIVLAWIGVAVMITAVILYYYHIASGGLL